MQLSALPSVSVVVPVYNDPERLRLCLRALERQSYPRGLYEVIVVDNGSDPPVAPLLGELGSIRLATEATPGSYAARNRGVDLATGEIFAFIDADCVPNKTWIENGVTRLGSTERCGLVGGKIVLTYRDPERPSAVEHFTRVALYTQQPYIERDHFAVTANLFTFRQVFEAVGLFDPALKSGGDVVWGRRVFAAGYAQLYAPEARVYHPATGSLRELYRRITRMVGGFEDIRRKQGRSPANLRAYVAFDLRRCRAYVERIFFDELLWRPSDKLRVLGVLVLAQQIVALERIRLLTGGVSRR